jgi:predicted Holliday junction resolvase-like endonuclease
LELEKLYTEKGKVTTLIEIEQGNLQRNELYIKIQNLKRNLEIINGAIYEELRKADAAAKEEKTNLAIKRTNDKIINDIKEKENNNGNNTIGSESKSNPGDKKKKRDD